MAAKRYGGDRGADLRALRGRGRATALWIAGTGSAARRRVLALGGCFAPEDGMICPWQCQQVHRRREPDESRWQADRSTSKSATDTTTSRRVGRGERGSGQDRRLPCGRGLQPYRTEPSPLANLSVPLPNVLFAASRACEAPTMPRCLRCTTDVRPEHWRVCASHALTW